MKNRARRHAAAVAGHQHLRAGRSFGEGQRPVFFHGEGVTKRDHQQDAENPRGDADQEHVRDARIQVEEDERRDREDDAGCE